MSSIPVVDWAVIAAYFAGMAWIAWAVRRRARTTEGYFLGSRAMPGWAVGFSIAGTAISSITFMALPADAYKTAWLRMLPNFVLPLGVLAGSLFFLGIYRDGRTTTAFEFLEARFGPSTRLYGAFTFVVGQLLRISLILFLLGQLTHELTGLSPEASILVAGLFVGGYTAVGGIEAVVWTDVAETVILTLGGAACLAVVLWKVPGGLREILATAWIHGKLSFADLGPDGALHPTTLRLTLTEKSVSMMLLVGLGHWLTEYACNQNMVQKYCASASTREARRALWIGCGWMLPLWISFQFLGTALWVFFQRHPTATSTGILAGTVTAERIVPHFVVTQLPTGFKGLVVAGVLAAAMSTLNSALNAIATVGVVDVYRRHIAKRRDDRHYLLVARSLSWLATIAMVAGALLLLEARTKTLEDAAIRLIALTSGGLLGLYLLGFLTRRGDGRSAAIAIGATLALSFYRAASPAPWFPDALRVTPLDSVHGYYTALLAHVVMFSVGWVASALLPRRRTLEAATEAIGA
ncbi:MAG TPA: sodium/solute symporter [Vicinamibacteria bacterium]|nr:sodium/solute symporter [Vicinamibacteria bacterium]